MGRFFFLSNDECFKVKFYIYFQDIHFTRNDYFLKNSQYTISSNHERKKKNKLKNATFIQEIDQLSRLKIDESMKFTTHLYRDTPAKYLEQYLPKYRKIIIRQKTKLNEFETLIRKIGFIELALHELVHEMTPMQYEFNLYDPDKGAEAVLRLMIQYKLTPIRVRDPTSPSSSSLKSILSFFKKPKDYSVSSRHDKNQEFFDILLRKDSTGRMSVDDDDDADEDVRVYTASDYDLTSKLDFNQMDSFFVDRNASTTLENLMPQHEVVTHADKHDAKASKESNKKKQQQHKQRVEEDDEDENDFVLEADGLGSIGFTDSDFRVAEFNKRALPSTPPQTASQEEQDLTPMSVDLMRAVEDIEFEMDNGGYNRPSIMPAPINTSHDEGHRIMYSLSYSHSPTNGASHGRKLSISEEEDDDNNSDLDYGEKLYDQDAATLSSKSLTAVAEEEDESSMEEEDYRPHPTTKHVGHLKEELHHHKERVVETKKPTFASEDTVPSRGTQQRSDSKRMDGKNSEGDASFGVSFMDMEDF